MRAKFHSLATQECALNNLVLKQLFFEYILDERLLLYALFEIANSVRSLHIASPLRLVPVTQTWVLQCVCFSLFFYPANIGLLGKKSRILMSHQSGRILHCL